MEMMYEPTPGFLMWRLTMKWQAAVDRAVAPLGLTHAQYSLLASLRGLASGGVRPSQRELAEHVGLDAIFVSKLIRTLERGGLVKRAEHPSDSRAFELTLTPTGTETIDQAILVVRALQEDLTEPLGGLQSARTKQLVNTMQRLLDVPQPDSRHETRSGTKGHLG